MTQYLCKNFGACDKADQQLPVELAPGSDSRCPECGSALHEAGPLKTPPKPDDRPRKLIVGVVIAVGALAAIGAGVAYKTGLPGSKPEALAMPHVPKPVPEPGAAPTGPTTDKPSECIVASGAPQGSVDARIQQHSQQSEEALKSGQSGDARQANNHALALQLVKSAIANLDQGRLTDAEADLNTARERDPDEPLVDYNLAIVRLRQQQPEAALKSLEQAFCKGFKAFDEMDKDTDLVPLRSNPAFAKLVGQYRRQ
jgi:tetratricopeptide (TPR) repeat protein